MKMTNLLLTIAATLGMTALTIAQNVPNYVSTNGLVGWWPFNGNANDGSANVNNGAIVGATLTSDRFGSPNNAYSFSAGYIICGNVAIPTIDTISISFWYNTSSDEYNAEIISLGSGGTSSWGCIISDSNFLLNYGRNCSGTGTSQINQNLTLSSWHHVVFVSSGHNNPSTIFHDGINIGTYPSNTGGACLNSNLYFGYDVAFSVLYNGKLDDIGIWNRALTQQEISDLYNSTNCSNNLTISPASNQLQISGTANFIATTSDPNPSYVWQSDLGQGFQTLNNFGNYSGTNTATLNVTNVQLSEHNQPIRVITTSGNCIDTSNVAIISITDTCINTITDTTLITVTDTLVINTTITGLNPPNNSNTIKVFPNPTNDHITIDYGNFNSMNGFQLKIENSLGQQVFQTNITQQSDYLNLTTWGGNGLYFVHIIDPQGNTIDIRKIVLQ